MDNSWIGWHQGEISSNINLLVSTSVGFMFLWSAVFIWWRSACSKNNLGTYVRPLYLSGNCEFSDSAMWQIYSLNCYPFPSPTAILCFYIFTFPNHQILSQPFTSKDKDTRACTQFQYSLIVFSFSLFFLSFFFLLALPRGLWDLSFPDRD